MNHLRHQKYKKEQLNNTQVLKVKNNSLELEKDFKPINISINDMGKFKKKNQQRREYLRKTCGMLGTSCYLTIFLSL